MKNITDCKIILASNSPRRKELLKHIVLDFVVKTKEIEEVYPSSLATNKVAAYLAELKANAFNGQINNNEVIITADTVVVLEDTIFGKPKDKEDAISILTKLSGKKHQVITGVCLKSKKEQIVFSNTTHVFFKKLTNEEIVFYVENYKPYDKAGAYAIQEWIGFIGVEKIEGDYNNIVGLPVQALSTILSLFCNSL